MKEKKQATIMDDELYTPKELSQIAEFRQYFGKTKADNLADNSVYFYILNAVRKKTLKAYNYGNGKTPYYKVWGKDARAFIKQQFTKQ